MPGGKFGHRKNKPLKAGRRCKILIDVDLEVTKGPTHRKQVQHMPKIEGVGQMGRNKTKRLVIVSEKGEYYSVLLLSFLGYRLTTVTILKKMENEKATKHVSL